VRGARRRPIFDKLRWRGRCRPKPVGERGLDEVENRPPASLGPVSKRATSFSLPESRRPCRIVPFAPDVRERYPTTWATAKNPPVRWKATPLFFYTDRGFVDQSSNTRPEIRSRLHDPPRCVRREGRGGDSRAVMASGLLQITVDCQRRLCSELTRCRPIGGWRARHEKRATGLRHREPGVIRPRGACRSSGRPGRRLFVVQSPCRPGCPSTREPASQRHTEPTDCP